LIRPTTVTYMGPLSGFDLGCGTTFSAKLTDNVTGLPMGGASILITIGSQSMTVVTDGTGMGTGTMVLTQPVPGYQPSYAVTASAQYAGQTGLYAASSSSNNFSISGDPSLLPGINASTLYTGSRFFWTTSSTSSTATLTLSATIRDVSPCGGNISKANVSFWISTDGNNFSPVPNAQNVPVGLVTPTDPSTGAASAISQYNLGKNPSAQLWVRVTVGGEYHYSADTYDVPVTIAIPGQLNTLLAGGSLNNDGASLAGSSGFNASGYLGALTSSTPSGALPADEADFGGQVTYNNKGTNPQGQLTLTIHSYNKPDGTSDGTEHSYFVKSNSISEMTLHNGDTVTFSSKTNVYEMTPDGKVGLDGGGVMQFTFTRPGGAYYVTTSTGTAAPLQLTCPSTSNGCASVVVFRSSGLGGGVWFSSAWGTAGGLDQTISKTLASGTTSIN